MPGMFLIMAGTACHGITMDRAELRRGAQEAQGRINRLANAAQAFSNKMLSIRTIAAPDHNGNKALALLMIKCD